MTIAQFFDLLRPLFDCLLGLLNYRIFGVPVYAVAFTMFLTLVFSGFVVSINVSGLLSLGSRFQSADPVEYTVRKESYRPVFVRGSNVALPGHAYSGNVVSRPRSLPVSWDRPDVIYTTDYVVH